MTQFELRNSAILAAQYAQRLSNKNKNIENNIDNLSKEYMIKFIADTFVAHRKAALLTQAEMSQIYLIPKRTIENWEAGTRLPPPYVILLVLKALRERVPIDNDLIKNI